MKQFDRELELGFEVSATEAVRMFVRRDMQIVRQCIIYQAWLEKGIIGDYEFRTRIRRTKIEYPDRESEKGKYEFTIKYSKNGESVAEQDNMELNAVITADEYEKLRKIYKTLRGDEAVKKIRTYFKDAGHPSEVYSLDIYPNRKEDKGRIEIEFDTEKEMSDYIPPEWLKKLIK